MKIKRADYDEALVANKLLTKLILTEKEYDSNINENCVVKSMYEKFYNNDDVCLLVAKEDDDIIGYLYGYMVNNGDSYINKVCALDAIYVVENKRKQGVATKLINEFKSWAKKNDAKYAELKVCINNKEAVRLYDKLGFSDVKVIKNISLEE